MCGCVKEREREPESETGNKKGIHVQKTRVHIQNMVDIILSYKMKKGDSPKNMLFTQ